MSLATRCTACGTIFRIVEDQLRVSDGWVRCGRCAEVFDARELLFDIERDGPPPWPPGSAPEAAEELPLPPPPPPLPLPPPPPAPAWVQPPEPAVQADDVLPSGWSTDGARQEPRWVDDDDSVLPPPTRGREAPAPLAAEPAAAPMDARPEATVPEFMRRAETGARWNRPGVRRAVALGAMLLGLLLALQVLLHFRDALAALHPPLRPALQAMCGVLGCDVGAWRRIEALGIDSTALSPAGSGNYKLSVALRNKTGVDVAVPWVELSLTDANGAPLARRVIGPEALSPQLQVIGAGAEQALSVSFSTGGQRVSGYNVNIFYP